MVALQLAVKNVYRKRERSFLTIIGVLLAVGSFISLLSIAEGLYNRVAGEVQSRAIDIYILPGDAAALPTGPLGTIGFSNQVLSKKLAEELEQIDEIRRVCPIYRIQQKIGGKAGATVIIWGINRNMFKDFFPKFRVNGKYFEDDTNEIVVGGVLAQEKGINQETPIIVEGKAFTTVGIGAPRGNFQDYFCFISLDTAMKLTKARGYQEIWLQTGAKNAEERELLAQKLREKFSALKLNIKTREEYLGAANEYINYAWLLQFAIAAIGVLIAMTAAMNTMLMSTYERIKEFGTLRSIGCSRFTVISMIMIESLMLTCIGGFGGIVLGVMGSRVLDEAVKAIFQLSFPLARITPQLILYSVILSGFVGVIGAIIPAIIVYRMSIIDSLRWE